MNIQQQHQRLEVCPSRNFTGGSKSHPTTRPDASCASRWIPARAEAPRGAPRGRAASALFRAPRKDPAEEKPDLESRARQRSPARMSPLCAAHPRRTGTARTKGAPRCGSGQRAPLRSPRRPPTHPSDPARSLLPSLTHQEAEDQAGECGGHGARGWAGRGGAAAVGAATAGEGASAKRRRRWRRDSAGARLCCPLPSATGAGQWGGWDRARQPRL